MKTTCSVCFVVGSVLLSLAICVESSGTLPGISATEYMICKTVAGAFGPCQYGGTGECKVVGSQSVCNANNKGLTCGTQYGNSEQINQICSNQDPEVPCEIFYDQCTKYATCQEHPNGNYYCGGLGGQMAYSWVVCMLN